MSDGEDVLRAIDQLRRDLSGYHGQLVAHNDLQRHCERQKEQLASLQAAHKPIKDERDLYKRQADRLAAENAKLREQTELLITLLRNDCDIEASWDGLRKFWNIGLTESGCLMRDRACKAEAENAELCELVRDALTTISWCTIDCYPSDNKKRELNDRARELGVEL